jgi:hypothetical protein
MRYTPVPVATVTLCRYAAYLARTISNSSIPGYLNIVRLLHLEAGLENPLLQWPVKCILKGIKRHHGQPPKRKLPITPDILRLMYNVIDLKKPGMAAFWAASLVAFFGFLRKSTLLPKNVKPKDINECLCQKDVAYKESGVLLSIRHTKTIQCHERVLQIPLPVILDSPLCPVSALKRLANVSGGYIGDQPLFSYKEGSKVHFLTYSSFLTILQAVIKACGLNADQYSGHSFRRGGATYAFSCGVPPMLIKAQGDWKSQAYQAYVDISLDQQWHMMKCLTQDL